MSQIQSKDQFRAKFYAEFQKISSVTRENSFYMDELSYSAIMQEVRIAKDAKVNNNPLTEVQRRRLARYDIAFDKLVAHNEGNIRFRGCFYLFGCLKIRACLDLF